MNIVLVNTYMYINKRELTTQVVFNTECFSGTTLTMEFGIGEHMGPSDNIVVCKSE